MSSAPTVQQKLEEQGFDQPLADSSAECDLPASVRQVVTKLKNVLGLREDQVRVNSTKAALTPDDQVWLMVGLRSNLTPASISFRRCQGHRLIGAAVDQSILDALDRVRSKCGKARHAVLHEDKAAWGICLSRGEDMVIVETMS